MPHATVFDLEFTAWPGTMESRWLRPGEFRELVQIGAVKIDAESFAVLGELNVLAKPKINPVLSDYLVKLTGVTNEALAERGLDFRDAYQRFVDFAKGGVICAFGRDDLIFAENIRLHDIKGAPPCPPYVNAVELLREHGIDPTGFHACDVARLCGAMFEGREHDALDDARSVAAGLKALVARGARNILLP
ncbi:MAG TPA: 3'-5' exonuclease [Rhizomicrobium sp.]|jgi:inhibitor of KinA sporulation pathway (predicted exonuclease)